MSSSIPSGWCTGALTEFTDLKHGFQFRTPDFSDKGIKVIKIGQVIGNGKIDLSTCDYVLPEIYEMRKSFSLKTGDILMSLTGNIGRVGIVPELAEPLLQNYRVGLFEPNSDACFKWYLFHLLSSEFVTDQLLDKSNTTAQANFGKSDLDQVVVAFPPLREQQKIAAILTSVDDVIESTQAQINKLKDLKTGMMQELLTKGIGHSEFKDSPVGRIPKAWDSVTILDSGIKVLDGDRGAEYPKDVDFFKYEYCLFLSAKNVTKFGFKFEQLAFITKEKDEKLRKGKLQLGDIVITTRGTVGNIAYFDNSVPFQNIRINSGMAIIRNEKTNFHSEFLNAVLHSRLVGEKIELMAFGSAQPQLTIGVIQNINLPLPPKDEQVKIFNVISSLQKKLDLAESKLSLFSNTKKGLMQDLLTGKVRVKVN